jgi:hypothetical protein
MAKDKRIPGHCTCCGYKLPESNRGWGLNWHDGAGMCAKCLYTIRKSIGYFDRLEKKTRQDQ